MFQNDQLLGSMALERSWEPNDDSAGFFQEAKRGPEVVGSICSFTNQVFIGFLGTLFPNCLLRRSPKRPLKPTKKIVL